MVVYNDQKTWADVSNAGGSVARDVISVLNRGLNEYNEWQSFRAGRTNAQIATDLAETGIAEADVAALDSCFAAGLALYNYADNGTPNQADYFFSLRKFS